MRLARPSIKALAAAGASAAVIASGSAAYAIYDAVAASTAAPASSVLQATPASAASARLAATGAKANAKAGARGKARAAALGGLVIGKVNSVSSTGGAASQGTIVVDVPDGKTVTANLVKRTRVLAYQGPGTKPTTESVGQLHQNEMVAVRIVRRPAASSGTGPSASGTASAGSSALTLTAASPATASGTAYAALIIDLGYAAANS